MKRPILQIWRKPNQPERPVEAGTPTEGVRIDISTPRECIYKAFDQEPGSCPRCGQPLIQSRQSYFVATKHGNKITDSLMVGSDFGWFCTNCPTVVINPGKVSELLEYQMPHWDVGSEFAVMGLVDLDAIPDEKADLPIGGDDNPVPLIEFSNLFSDQGRSQHDPPGGRARSRAPIPKRKQKNRKQRKRR